MRSLDTNVLIRFMLGDDPDQAAVAARILDEPARVTVTVALECFWVLRRVAGWSNAQVAEGFAIMFELAQLRFDQAQAVRWALQRSVAGGDFADMLHLALSAGADSFATFDCALARFGRDSAVPVELLG